MTIGFVLLAAVIASIFALHQPLYGAGILYVSAFLAVAWRFPAAALAFSFAAAPFQYDLSAGGPVKFSLGELSTALTLVVLLARNVLLRRKLIVGPMAAPALIYLAICFLASYRAGFSRDDIVALAQMALYLLATVLVFASAPVRISQLRWCLYGAVGVVTALAALALTLGTGHVLGIHKNGIGASEACALVICIELWFAARAPEERRLLSIALAVLSGGLVFSLSRGAWACALVGFLVVVGMRRRFVLLARATLVLIPLVGLFWLFLPAEKREYATSFDPNRYNIRMRLNSIEFARKQWEKEPILGVGVGLRKQFDATSLVWTSLAETGVVGLIGFLTLHLVFFALIARTRRRLEPSEEVYSLVAIAAALVLGKFVHGMVDHYWSRGSLLMVWASVGMATRVFLMSRGTPARELVFRPGEEVPWKRR